MSLRNNLSRLSPNEFLEKMQDLMNMYMESVNRDKIPYHKVYHMASDLMSDTMQSILSDNFSMSYYIKNNKQEIVFLSILDNNKKYDKKDLLEALDVIYKHFMLMVTIYKENNKDNNNDTNKTYIAHLKNELQRFKQYAKKYQFNKDIDIKKCEDALKNIE